MARAARPPSARPARRYAVRLQAGAESFDNYTAGALTVEDTRPFFASGALRRTDTIDSNFGFGLAAFPDPFNAPYVRTSNEIPSSGAHGRFLNLSSLFRVGERRTVRVRYQRREMDDVGFPDFVQPYFFNATSLPKSDLDRVSARYEAQAVTSWLANLSLTAHYQRTQRVLQNLLPVQFPAPTAGVLLPDQCLQARHPVRNRTARLDAGRRSSGRDGAGCRTTC